MILEDRILIEASPERIFDFFEHMDEHYLAWHPDHIAFRWTKGRGLKPGVEFYFEEYIGGKLMKKTVRFTRIDPFRHIAFEPTWWLMRLVMPRLSFEIQPQADASLFIAKIPIRTGPVGAWLNRREFDAVRRHMQEEGQNLKRMLEQGRVSPEQAAQRGI
jgi:hypothetical protein